MFMPVDCFSAPENVIEVVLVIHRPGIHMAILKAQIHGFKENFCVKNTILPPRSTFLKFDWQFMQTVILQ